MTADLAHFPALLCPNWGFQACEKLLLANAEAGRGEQLGFGDLQSIYQDELDAGKVSPRGDNAIEFAGKKPVLNGARGGEALSMSRFTSTTCGEPPGERTQC